MTVQVYEQKKKGRDLECNCFLSPASYVHPTRKEYIDDLGDTLWVIVWMNYVHLCLDACFLLSCLRVQPQSEDSENKVSRMSRFTLKQILKTG